MINVPSKVGQVAAVPVVARSSVRLAPVRVEGVRGGSRFVLPDELKLLAAPPEPPASVAFRAPLDPFVWDRDLLPALFGFGYVWEVYVPERKRRWGYFVLPIHFRDRLVGRIEPRINRAGGRVQVLGLVGGARLRAAPRRRFVDAMRAALGGFAGARGLEWGAPHLDKEKRLFRSRPHVRRTQVSTQAAPG